MLGRNLKTVALILFAAVTCMLGAAPASASDARLKVKALQIREVGAIAATDTTFLTDEADTIRTVPISTIDWDWDAIIHSQLTGGNAAARIWFVSTTGTNNAVTDTIYYTVEQGTGAPGDTAYTLNTNIAAAVGSVALASGGGSTFAGAQSNVWCGALIADTDGLGANNLLYCPSFRIRFLGDISGTTPKVSGVKVFVSYPQRGQDIAN